MADIPDFLNHIEPVLERYLLSAPVTGYTGQRRLNLFDYGMELTFAEGKLSKMAAFQPELLDHPDD
jgi:hypothetical protein